MAELSHTDLQAHKLSGLEGRGRQNLPALVRLLVLGSGIPLISGSSCTQIKFRTIFFPDVLPFPLKTLWLPSPTGQTTDPEALSVSPFALSAHLVPSSAPSWPSSQTRLPFQTYYLLIEVMPLLGIMCLSAAVGLCFC